jgi:sulfur-carrier protein
MKIFIPTPLRAFTGKQDTVDVTGANIQQVLDGLTSRYPDLRKHLFTEEGRLRSFVNVYLNDEDIRYLDAKEQTAVQEADSLSIIPSIAGGCSPRFALHGHGGRSLSIHG